jgi:predicted metalloprotease with PDZ domain
MLNLCDRFGAFRRCPIKVLFGLMICTATFIPSSYGQCNFASASVGNPLTYVFEPVVADGKLVLRVTLELRGGHDGTTELELPSDWAGQSHLEAQVNDLRALSHGALLLNTARPNIKTLRFAPDQLVTISYNLMKDWQGAFEYPNQFRAVLEPEFFEFTTQNALVHPKLASMDTVNVNFDWQKLPTNWTLETSFGVDNRCQSFTGLWHQVNDALFAGGDFRIYRVTVEGRPVVVAIRGQWSFTDEEAGTQIQKIIAVEREFWQDYDFPYYLVTLVPFDTQSGSSDGSAFTNAFWLYVSVGDKFSYGVQNLVAHETFHAWNPHKMGLTPEPEATVKWFTEGFTVYYADLLLLRSGLLSLPDYIERLNRRIRDYESSPVKNLSNREVVARYNEISVNQLPYVQGPIIALWLDAEIRRQSKNKSSLDTVMHGLVSDESRNPALELTSERVLRVAGNHLNRGSRNMLHSFVEEGTSIPLPGLSKNPCVYLTTEDVSPFDLGFDGDVLIANKKISDVRRDSEAFKAGVRDGQEVFGISIYWGDVNKPVRLTVRSGSSQQKIEYFPKGKPIPIPQYHVDKKAWSSTPERCSLP